MGEALFWRLSEETRARLMMAQHDYFGTELTIPGLPEALRPKVEDIKPVLTETPGEINKIMRQPPSRSRGDE